MFQKRMRKAGFVIACILLMAAPALAKEGHLTLLAVHEEDGIQTGATADLNLEIKPGTGKVFLNTFPLTKIDTQISTRFANSIACDFIGKDCSRYDFFYTIRAESSIIGGPSAGAAVAALTVFLLEDLKYDQKIMITGTINSGGIVGPVGGIKAKIKAASLANSARVLIPKGERKIKEENKTVDIYEYGRNLSIGITEVATLDDVVFMYTGKHIREQRNDLKIDESYVRTMAYLAHDLCTRGKALEKMILAKTKLEEQLGKAYTTAIEQARNLSARGERAYKDKQYYSSASYCFGSNVRYQQIIQKSLIREKEQALRQINIVEQNISIMEKQVRETQLRTITDLQAYIVVSERLSEAREQLRLALGANNSQDNVAFAAERLYSAKAWAKFFGQSGKEYIFNEQVLKESCMTKIAEAEESYQYVTLFFPNILEATSKDISQAYKFASAKQYALCLSKAMNAKASSNSLLGAIGVDEENILTLLQEKLDVGMQVIIQQSEENSFPILGYSYWEYANSLAKYDKYSALLYSEYALELSNLDIYFKKKETGFRLYIEPAMYWVFALGLTTGILVGWMLKKGISPTAENGKKKALTKANAARQTKSPKR
jgi:uncharacterized protein